MKRYLIDTNHLASAIGRVSRFRDRMQSSVISGVRFATCGPVLCELMAGLINCSDAERTKRKLHWLLDDFKIWPTDFAIAGQYAAAFHEARAKGRALSFVDLLLVAIARTHSAAILTTDRDFDAFPDIVTENWL